MTWTDAGIEYEPDQRHVELIVKESGIDHARAKACSTPGIKEKLGVESDLDPLPTGTVTKFRSVCMRINYLAQDRSDIQYSAKEMARGMQNPTSGHWSKLKRLARYLKARPRVILQYKFQEPCSFLDLLVDTGGWFCKACSCDIIGLAATR